MMDSRRIHAVVHGEVQGVAFREYTRREASRLGLLGWVRNLPDGSVEVVFEGTADQAESLLSWLATGSPFSQVSRVEYKEETCQGEMRPFFIRYDTL
jgi:acylphosphatase